MQFFQQFEKVKQINIGYVIRAGVVQIDSDVLPGANWRVRSDWCAASYRHVESESLIVLSAIAANSDCFHINLSNIAFIKHSLWSMGRLCFQYEIHYYMRLYLFLATPFTSTGTTAEKYFLVCNIQTFHIIVLFLILERITQMKIHNKILKSYYQSLTVAAG